MRAAGPGSRAGGAVSAGGSVMEREGEREEGGETRYDSFQVRLWWRAGSPDLLRLEVRHLQSGATDFATGVPLQALIDIVAAFSRQERTTDG